METGLWIARFVHRTHVALSFSLLVACAGDGQGLDANGRPLMPGGGRMPPPLSATFDSLQANVFTPICSVCHAGGAAPEGLRLDAANSYSLLVGVPSSEVPALLRVKPGDPDNSYLVQKLEGHAAVGAQMPFGCPTTQPCLSTTTIAFFRQWIIDGAAPPVSAADAGDALFLITSVVPDEFAPIKSSPPQVLIAFNHEIDVTQVDNASARIEKLGSDVAGPIEATIPVRMTVPAANLRTLLLWPSRALEVGRYRVILEPENFRSAGGQGLSMGRFNDQGEAVVSTFEVVP